MVLVERCRIGYGNHFSSYFQLRPAIDGLLQTSRICPVMNSGMLGVRLALATKQRLLVPFLQQHIAFKRDLRLYLCIICMIPGSSDQKNSTRTGSHRSPLYQCWYITARASMAVFFEGSAKRGLHTTLKLGDRGWLTVLARVQVGWTFFWRPPVYIYMYTHVCK